MVLVESLSQLKKRSTWMQYGLIAWLYSWNISSLAVMKINISEERTGGPKKMCHNVAAGYRHIFIGTARSKMKEVSISHNLYNCANTTILFQSRKRLYNHKCPLVSPSVHHQNPQQLEIIILHNSSFNLDSFRNF